MGVLFSCFHVPDEQDDDVVSNNSSSNHCLCPKCLFQKLKIKHGNIFGRGQTSASSSLNQQAVFSNSRLLFHNSSDANQASDGARERREKGTCNLLVQPNPKSIQLISKEQNSESSAKVFSSRVDEVAYIFASPDDEDVCPTCLEDYTEENPKIIPKCSHHYHLSCIYEWMERSQNCPICGKLMLFDESS